MRLIILDHLSAIKQRNNNFSKSSMRWRNFNVSGVHISEIPFGDYEYMDDNYTDHTLLLIYDRVIIQNSKQY